MSTEARVEPVDRHAAKMNIGEVHARLREDFPSLELSKLRYFEAK